MGQIYAPIISIGTRPPPNVLRVKGEYLHFNFCYFSYFHQARFYEASKYTLSVCRIDFIRPTHTQALEDSCSSYAIDDESDSDGQSKPRVMAAGV
jgi:hypothetical protein